jgi:hypothetical protein
MHVCYNIIVDIVVVLKANSYKPKKKGSGSMSRPIKS